MVMVVRLRMSANQRKLIRLYATQKNQSVDTLLEAFALDIAYDGPTGPNITPITVPLAHTWLDTRFPSQKSKR